MMISRSPDWLSAKVDDEVVMMNGATGHIVGVNALGAEIWHLLEAPRDVAALEAELIASFDVSPEACRAELTAFLDELAGHGAISRAA